MSLNCGFVSLLPMKSSTARKRAGPENDNTENTLTPNISATTITTMSGRSGKSSQSSAPLRDVKNQQQAIPSGTIECIKKRKLFTWSENAECCQWIINELELKTPRKYKFANPVELFEWICTEGLLTVDILDFFKQCPMIDAILFTASFATKLSKLGLKISPKIDGLTKPLYTGYANVKALDFSGVEIVDDHCRYLVKLEQLSTLSISGSKISDKAFRYLVKHAAFVPSLKYLDISHNMELTSAVIDSLKAFMALNVLKINGTNLLLTDLLKLIEHTVAKLFKRITVGKEIFEELKMRHAGYLPLMSKLAFDETSIDVLQSQAEILRQCKAHKKFYPFILPQDPSSLNGLKRHLKSIASRRALEEYLWSIIELN